MIEIEEAECFTGFVLCVPGPDGRERLINVTEQEYLRHRQLLPCTPRAAETKVIFKKDIF
jgi:hypothetical protein